MSFPSNTPGMLGNTDLIRFDALIIGSGAGGSAAAYALTAEPYAQKVLILEAGDNHFPGLDALDGREGIPWPLYSNDEIKLSLRRFAFQDPLVEPRTFRQTEDQDAYLDPDVNVMTRNVGGAAVISSVSYPRFTVVDFRMKTALEAAGRLTQYLDTGFADWPLTYDELEPFYTETDVLSGIAGIDPPAEGHDPFQSARSKRFPLPPQPVMYVARVLANGAKQLGYHPFNYPSAIITAPYAADPRPLCVSCGLCTNYGCPRNAKGSPAVTTLRRALLTGNCQLRYNAFATRLTVDATGRRVTGVEYIDNSGQRQTVTADKVLLAASAIESARLCLLSGIGNSRGLVGRHLTFHLENIAVGIYKQRLHGERGRSITMGMADFRGIMPGGADLQTDRPLGGAIEFGTSSEPTVAARDTLQPEAVGAARLAGASFKQLIAESPFSAHIAILLMHAEDAPQATNRIDLDPNVRDVFGLPVPRVTYKNHAFELDAVAYYKPLMLRIHEKAGAAYGFFQPFDPKVPSQSRHIMGGLRMGADPSTSVCDRWGKFHDLDNLYCADGAVFPTGSGYNPTPTIIAMALRTAGAIVSPGAPERTLRFAR